MLKYKCRVKYFRSGSKVCVHPFTLLGARKGDAHTLISFRESFLWGGGMCIRRHEKETVRTRKGAGRVPLPWGASRQWAEWQPAATGQPEFGTRQMEKRISSLFCFGD